MAAGTHPALQVAISSVESSSDLQRFNWQLGQQLEGHKASLEALTEEQRRLASEEAQQRHQEVLNRLAQLQACTAVQSEPSPTFNPDIEHLIGQMRLQQHRVEEMQQHLEAGLERAAPSIRLAEHLEVLYARHEARLEAMLVQNEKVMEEYLQQVRQVSKNTHQFKALSGSSLRQEYSGSNVGGRDISTPTSRDQQTFASPAIRGPAAAGDKFSMGHLNTQKRRIGDTALDVTSLCAVQGWRSWVETTHVRHRARSFTLLKQCSEATLEMYSTVLVISNLIWMGIDTNVALRYAELGQSSPAWLWGINLLFLSLLVGELCLRISLERWNFLLGANRHWNLFDCALIIVQVVDSVLVLINGSFLRLLRLLRLLRSARAFKTMHSVRELRVMLATISTSLGSMLWAFLLLFMTLYAASLALGQSVLSFLNSRSMGDSVNQDLFKYYGSVEQSMLSLFMAVSHGRDWGSLVDPLAEMSTAWILAYVVFVIFIVFGLLNVVTAIFVESASKVAQHDHELVIQEHLEAKNSTAQQLRRILYDADADESGSISLKEFEVKMKDSRFVAQLSALELDIFEAHGLFNILKYEEGKGVPIEDFIYGLMRMKGTAKGIDMVTLMTENRRILSKLLAFMEFTDDSLQDLRASLHVPGECVLQDYLDQSPP